MKKLLNVLLVLLLAFTLVGCGEQKDKEPEFEKKEISELKVGIAFYAYASTSAIRQLDYFKYVFTKAGATVVDLVCNNSVEQQIADIESLIQQKCDVIVLDPCQQVGYDAALDACKEAGIPVFVMGNRLDPDTYVAGEDYVTLLQSDMTVQGQNVAKAALTLIEKGLTDHINAVVTFGTAGMQSSTDRINGWNAIDTKESKIVTFACQTAYNKAAEAQAIYENYLTTTGGPYAASGKGINVLIAMTHNNSVGAIAAVKNLGYELNKDVFVIVCDGVKEDLQAIMDNELYMAVESPCFYADQQLELIKRYFQGEKLEGYYEIVTTQFDSTNAKEWYDNFNEYDKLIGLAK